MLDALNPADSSNYWASFMKSVLLFPVFLLSCWYLCCSSLAPPNFNNFSVTFSLTFCVQPPILKDFSGVLFGIGSRDLHVLPCPPTLARGQLVTAQELRRASLVNLPRQPQSRKK